MNKKFIYIILTIFVAVFAGTLTFFILTNKPTPAAQPAQNNLSNTPSANQPAAAANTPAVNQPIASTNTNTPPATIEYANEQYRFNFTLPESWTGYTVLTDKWQSYPINDTDKTSLESGPLLTIRHPQWTTAVPRQDIPIMVFTIAQWSEVIGAKINISAAPIPPTVLGTNANYVFALPARYNFAFPAGYEEVDQIIQSNPLHAF